jgi:hypothetical protein
MGSAMAVHDDIAEPPLEPAAERLRRKLVRLLVVSGGIMMLGLIAVFAAIVYKVGESRPGRPFSALDPVESEIRVPAGFRIVHAELEGERALLTLEGPDGSTSLLFVDLGSGAVLGRYAIARE